MTKEELEEKKKRRKKRKKRKVKKKKGKRDACYHKIKRTAKVWPSAYASGRLVQCRKVGAANYGNKSKKKNESLNEDFKPHMMYDPKTGKSEKANEEEDHHRLAKKGYTHIDPEGVRDVIGDGEGGASGPDPLLKKFGKEMEDEIMKTLKAMPDIGQHKDGDYIMDDDKEIQVQKEEQLLKKKIRIRIKKSKRKST